MSQVHQFTMEMTCDGCAGAARRVLSKLGDKVSNVEINVDTKSVVVTSTSSADELKETLEKTGKTISYKGVLGAKA